MTARRSKIASSLAERGRPAMWANEAEAAVLSGVGAELFRAKVKDWESRGFPQINPENGKRSIPAILAFWRLPSNPREQATPPSLTVVAEDDDGKENWGGQSESIRRAS